MIGVPGPVATGPRCYTADLMSEERPAADAGQRQQHYPTQCPSCRDHTGKPKSASTVPGEPLMIRLQMLCGKCAHEWTHDKIDEKPE